MTRASPLADLRSAKVSGLEAESATPFTLARVFGPKAGAVFSAAANRATSKFNVGAGAEDAVDVAVEGDRRFRQFGV
jgi:uridine phosphorylase